MRVCVCVRVRACVHECVCVRAFGRVCVYVCVCARARARVCERARGCVYMRLCVSVGGEVGQSCLCLCLGLCVFQSICRTHAMPFFVCCLMCAVLYL